MNTISPLAFVHPEAQMGDNNVIGPFCYIDRNTVMGDNNTLMNSVTIHYGARIGSNNEFFPGASISTKPQDLKFQGEDSLCEIGDNNSIRENVTISRGTASKGVTRVGNNCLLMENMHVAHDCVLGNHLIIGNSTKFKVQIASIQRSSMPTPPFVACSRVKIKKAEARLYFLHIAGLRPCFYS